jgi:hypothetical protein
MMTFRTVKTAIQDLLDTQAAGRFRVIGKQVMSKSADEIKDNDRLVQVYFSDGNFPKSAGRLHGSKTHDITIEIDMTASAGAVGDLSILDNPAATAIQKAAAIAAIREASEIADTKIDELVDAVYNILMDARYESLSLPIGTISSRWIDRIQKDTLLERGEFVVKTANMKYTCRVQEYVSGDIGNQPARVIYDSTTPISADVTEIQDTTEKTGVIVDVDNS